MVAVIGGLALLALLALGSSETPPASPRRPNPRPPLPPAPPPPNPPIAPIPPAPIPEDDPVEDVEIVEPDELERAERAARIARDLERAQSNTAPAPTPSPAPAVDPSDDDDDGSDDDDDPNEPAADDPVPPTSAPSVVIDIDGPAVRPPTPAEIERYGPPDTTPVLEPPEGYDPELAQRLAAPLAAHLKSMGRDRYSRDRVRAFQRAAGLKVDGIYGGATRGALLAFGVTNPPRPFFRPVATIPYTGPIFGEMVYAS